MEEDKELQRKVRDNFIVSLAAYIKVGRPDDFVHDIVSITDFFSRLPSKNQELYNTLCHKDDNYNIITQKVDELINNLKSNIINNEH